MEKITKEIRRDHEKREGAAIENHFGGDQPQSPERTLNLDTVRMDMILLNGPVRTEAVLGTGVPIVC